MWKKRGKTLAWSPRKQLGHLSLGKWVPRDVTKTHPFHGSDEADKCLDCAPNFKSMDLRSFSDALGALGCVQFGYLLRKQAFHRSWGRKLVHGRPRLYLIKSCCSLEMEFGQSYLTA